VLSGLDKVGLITSYEVDGQRYSDWFDFSQGALELVSLLWNGVMDGEAC